MTTVKRVAVSWRSITMTLMRFRPPVNHAARVSQLSIVAASTSPACWN